MAQQPLPTSAQPTDIYGGGTILMQESSLESSP